MKARTAELVASIEAKLARADDPKRVRVHDGRMQVGYEAGRCLVWRAVPFLSSHLLSCGYGIRQDDDGVPF